VHLTYNSVLADVKSVGNHFSANATNQGLTIIEAIDYWWHWDLSLAIQLLAVHSFRHRQS